MSDRSKVPPPPWATKDDPPRSTDERPPAAGAPGDKGSAPWPSLDEVVSNRAAGAAQEQARPRRPAPDPEPEAIPLDQALSPDGPRSPYGGSDDGLSPEPPQRIAAPGSAPAAPPEPTPTAHQAARPGAIALGAASGMIRTEATPMWRIVTVRYVIPLVMLLVLITGYRFWVTKSAFKTTVTHGTIMGFDANILDAFEETAVNEGYRLGEDGVQGWLLGAERRWIIRVHVRCRALLVVPYYTHFVFEGDLPYNLHVDTHLNHFSEDTRWSFDETMIQQYSTLDKDKGVIAAEVVELRQRSLPPPR